MLRDQHKMGEVFWFFFKKEPKNGFLFEKRNKNFSSICYSIPRISNAIEHRGSVSPPSGRAPVKAPAPMVAGPAYAPPIGVEMTSN
jgi:hypothetical protein